MTVTINSSSLSLFQLISLFGVLFFCVLAPENETLAAPSTTAAEGATLIQQKTDDPHLRLQSGIVGLALHLTAKRVGDPAQLIIRAVHPSGPAARAGITHGEEIFSVNGQAITGQTYQETVSHIRGEIGSSVKLGLRGPQGERTLTLIRVNESILMEQTPQTM